MAAWEAFQQETGNRQQGLAAEATGEGGNRQSAGWRTTGQERKLAGDSKGHCCSSKGLARAEAPLAADCSRRPRRAVRRAANCILRRGFCAGDQLLPLDVSCKKALRASNKTPCPLKASEHTATPVGRGLPLSLLGRGGGPLGLAARPAGRLWARGACPSRATARGTRALQLPQSAMGFVTASKGPAE
jgi:hypothetical protein